VQVVQKPKMTVTATLLTSPIEQVSVAGYPIYIKRDDLLNTHFSGNKARKFAHYLEQDLSHITHIVSYGSVQANSLYSLAALAHLKGWQLHYYVTRIPTWLQHSTIGNYGQARALGANIIEIKNISSAPNITRSTTSNTANQAPLNLNDIMHEHAKTLPTTALFIPEGGRNTSAQLGVNQLAKELAQYCQQNTLITHNTPAKVMLPAGTGTTALFLQTWFSEHHIPIDVLTCACVGDENYLKQQFQQLNPNSAQWPTILPTAKNYHFGKLNPNHYQLWHQIYQETGIEFELLYDPIGWECLLNYLAIHKENTAPLFYIHQGGIMGNQTMLPRYKRKYPQLF